MIEEKKSNKHLLNTFFFGDSDWKNEATYNSNFIKYYYDWLGYYWKLLEPRYWLILWRKWTWKSLLGWYFHANLNKNENFSQVISYWDFRYDFLNSLSNWDIKPNQYIPIWKFLLLLHLWKEILKDLSLEGDKDFIKLKKFIEENFNLNLDQNRVLEIISTKKLKWEMFGFWWEWGKEEKWAVGSFMDYADKLKEIVVWLIERSKNNFYITIDELDDRFRRNDENKDILISLIKATQSINILLYNTDWKSKIIVLLRTDIFSFLKDTDLQKIRDDNWIDIKWESKIDTNSQLLKMLVYKIQKSQPEFEWINYIDIFTMLFPQSIRNRDVYIPPEKFLLERTFFRPRDVIAYLKRIVDQYPNTTFVWWKAFVDAEKEYSKYLLGEIENELIGHCSEDFITNWFKLLKQFNKPKFTIHELRAYLNSNHNRFPDIELEKFLEIFFDFWILWNSWNGVNWFVWYSSTIRDDRAEVDMNKEFVLHLWLRRAILN